MAKEPLKSSHRNEMRLNIIDTAIKAFHTHGVKSVTMDDIAHSLTMSKRTLYQIFSDKEELLMACLQQKEEENVKTDMELLERYENVLDFLLHIFENRMREFEVITPNFFTELGKYPKVTTYFSKRNRAHEDEAVEFLNKGIEQGYFRPDVNFVIIYRQLTLGLKLSMNSRELTQFSQRELFINTVIPYIRGCATLKGIEIIDRFIDKYRSAEERDAD